MVLSGPSGVGKTLFVKRALKEYPQFKNTVTYTTRAPREGEKPGEHYYFVDSKQFEKFIKEGKFVEFAEVHGELYGTSHDEVCRIWKEKKTIIKDLDIQGAESIKKSYPQSLTLFIYPPNMEVLKERLEKRGVQDTNNLEKRLVSARKEIAKGRLYDFKIVNDNFEEAWQEFKKIIEKSNVL